MGTREKSRYAERIFTLLMQRAVDKSFRFPGGAIAARTVSQCLNTLSGGRDSLSVEKITDFCVCQVYAISFFGADYIRRWRPSHSFGQKAIERFRAESREKRYYQDLWLRDHGLSRTALSDAVRDRSRHPLSKFIYPESEDQTKGRQMGTEAGFYVCSVSTLMWTPFSPVCASCTSVDQCKEATKRLYPELYRIRVEEYEKGGGK